MAPRVARVVGALLIFGLAAIIVYVALVVLAVNCIGTSGRRCTTVTEAKVQLGLGVTTAVALIATGVQLARSGSHRGATLALVLAGSGWLSLVADLVGG